jgi:hypothetical protein
MWHKGVACAVDSQAGFLFRANCNCLTHARLKKSRAFNFLGSSRHERIEGKRLFDPSYDGCA